MAEQSAISWTDATWNPWRGCIKVSSGCKNCYMFRDQERYGRDPSVVVRSKTTFRDPLKWKEPKLIFTCSWSDWFIEEADEWRDDAWEIIRQTPQHTYQILTKRPELMIERLPKGWPLKNVWLGVSAEDQRTYDLRMPALCIVPATVRFLSAEPLLGPIDLDLGHYGSHLGWVIVGGESGPERRKMDPRWAQSIRDQCVNAGVPFFFKQWDNAITDDKRLDGQKWEQMPVLSGCREEDQ